jgi:hypothetical protein
MATKGEIKQAELRDRMEQGAIQAALAMVEAVADGAANTILILHHGVDVSATPAQRLVGAYRQLSTVRVDLERALKLIGSVTTEV